MTHWLPRVVYDCNVLFQALISTRGPAYRCHQLVWDRRVTLLVSGYVIDEVREISARPILRSKFQLNAPVVEAFLAQIVGRATYISAVPEVYQHPLDPKDSHYVNLALAGQAELIVSRDHHLLNLVDPGRPEGARFLSMFPGLRIMDPVAFIRQFEQEISAAEESG